MRPPIVSTAATCNQNNVNRTPTRTPERQHTMRGNDQYQQTPEDSDTNTEISSIRSLLSQYQMELKRKEKEHQAQLQQQHQRSHGSHVFSDASDDNDVYST
jgi:hypothetical protein